MKLSLPSDILVQAPGAYLVGGSVRDLICGRRPVDYDITVANDPKGYAEQLALKLKGRVVTIEKHPFRLYRVVKSPLIIDVTPLKGTGISSDLADRDFTINALACELTTSRLIDTTGGLADINQGVVRMVSPQAFQNDPARLVRAYRMAVSLNFDIEAATAAAIATHANMIQRCAGERIWTELALILACPNSFGQLYKMAHSGLLNAIFPELGPLKGCRQSEPHHLDVFEHTLLAYQALEALLAHPTRHLSGPAAGFATALPKEHQVLLKLALLLHDIGKPGQRTTDAAGKVHFYGHAGAGAQLAGPIFKRLHLSRRHANWVEGVIGQHQRPLALYVAQSRNGLRPKAIGKFLRVGGAITPHLIVHAMADNLGKNPTNHHHHLAPMAFWEQLLNAYFATAAPPGAPPLLGGHDLMAAFGLTPSPLLGTLLRGIEEARLAGTIGNRQQALEWVERYLKEKERRSK